MIESPTRTPPRESSWSSRGSCSPARVLPITADPVSPAERYSPSIIRLEVSVTRASSAGLTPITDRARVLVLKVIEAPAVMRGAAATIPGMRSIRDLRAAAFAM